MVPDNSDGISRVPPYSGAAPGMSAFRVPASHRLRGSIPSPSATLACAFERSYNPGTRRNAAGLGSSPFARRYWENRCYFLFLRVLRCFSSPRSPQCYTDVGIAPYGLPHSDICGSRCICHSPQLFAACHVLLRLREPRHPPCALRSFRFNGMPDDILLARASPAPPKPFCLPPSVWTAALAVSR